MKKLRHPSPAFPGEFLSPRDLWDIGSPRSAANQPLDHPGVNLFVVIALEINAARPRYGLIWHPDAVIHD